MTRTGPASITAFPTNLQHRARSAFSEHAMPRMDKQASRLPSGDLTAALSSAAQQRQNASGRHASGRMQPTRIILAIGAPGAGHDAIFDTLVRCGVLPANPSRRDGHTPQALSRLLLQAQEVDAADAPLEQLRPGKVWQELAMELALSNLQQPLWGWSDHQLGWLMDFWQDLDPQVRLLLVYTTPANHLAQSLREQPEPAAAGVESALRQWHEWNRVLLRYHLRHPERTLLVNAQAALAEPAALLQLLNHSWGVNQLQEAEAVQIQKDPAQTVLSHAAQALIGSQHAVTALIEQIHSVAQLAGMELVEPERSGISQWIAARDLLMQRDHAVLEKRAQADAARHEYQRMQLELQQAREELQQHVLLLQEGRKNADQLRLRCDHLDYELQLSQQARAKSDAAEATLKSVQAGWANEKASLANARDQAAKQLADLLARPAPSDALLGELKRDNELLSLQLQQAQEELERYFLECQKLEQARHADSFLVHFWRTQQPDVVTIDLRNDVMGEQWHDAEVDGRWSGPGTVSSLKLPPIQGGNYLLELDVVYAMAPDLLPSARIEFHGKTQPLTVKYLGAEGSLLAVCSATFTIDDILARTPADLKLHLVRTGPPSETGSTDPRHLGLHVQRVRLIRHGRTA